jgi:hypothetical protein
MKAAAFARAILTVLVACGGGEDPPQAPVFPMDYATTFQEVRNCRFSLDHDLARIRILASPDAVQAYTDRVSAFPDGAIIVKEEYDEQDEACAGPFRSFTAMQKLTPGSGSDTLDWYWEESTGDFAVVETDVKRCVNCHTDCGKPPEGYDGTCAVP